MGFRWKDNVIYDELWDVAPVAAVTAEDPAVVNDVFGFYITDGAAAAETTFVYECRQVEADKVTGTGEDIQAGEYVYAVVADSYNVTANPTGTAGTDYYYCGIAKKDAAASATTVLIKFDGTRYTEDI